MRGIARMRVFFVKLKYTLSQIESQGLLNKHTMRNHPLDAWRLALRNHVRRMDIAAVALLLAYATLAGVTQLGASVAGQGPDPVWAAARQRGILRVAVDFGYYPFSGVRQGQPIGYDIELAQA